MLHKLSSANRVCCAVVCLLLGAALCGAQGLITRSQDQPAAAPAAAAKPGLLPRKAR
jgi:hypothetical protein